MDIRCAQLSVLRCSFINGCQFTQAVFDWNRGGNANDPGIPSWSVHLDGDFNINGFAFPHIEISLKPFLQYHCRYNYNCRANRNASYGQTNDVLPFLQYYRDYMHRVHCLVFLDMDNVWRNSSQRHFIACPSSKVHPGQDCIIHFYIEFLLGFVRMRTESPATMRIQTIFQSLQLPKVADPRYPAQKQRFRFVNPAYERNPKSGRRKKRASTKEESPPDPFAFTTAGRPVRLFGTRWPGGLIGEDPVSPSAYGTRSDRRTIGVNRWACSRKS